MFKDIKQRVKKVGQPPGTASYTGEMLTLRTDIEVAIYSPQSITETQGSTLEKCLPKEVQAGITWVNVEGLSDIKPIEELATRFNLHPLTVEDILNVSQRCKVEEYDNYLFVSMKMLLWVHKQNTFSIEQLTLVVGNNFVLSFQEKPTTLFDEIRQRLASAPNQRLRQQGSDYLAYRLIDAAVDQYFVVLENMGDKIESLENHIISSPTQKNARTLYNIKREMLLLRKSIWPMREVVSHLLQIDEPIISSFTRIYLRDVYDHTIHALDTVETFRDMLANILDVYLSTLTNRMNEIMKVLTIIATVFIPMTFIASVFGMNFKYMPELSWRWGYPAALSLMAAIGIVMLIYFWRKKWL